MTAWHEFDCPDCGARCNNQVMHLCPLEAQLARLKAEVLELRQVVARKAPPGFWGRATAYRVVENLSLTRELETWRHMEHRQGLRAIEAEKQLNATLVRQETMRRQFMAAINFATDDNGDGLLFLRDWREGDTSQWPDFKETPSNV